MTSRTARVATALAVVAAAVGGCGGGGEERRPGLVEAGPARPGLRVGVAVNFRVGGSKYVGNMARLVRGSGARLVRDDFRWEAIEARPGRYRWREPDRIVTLAASKGLGVLPLLTKAPSWATGRTRGDYDIMPRDPARFAAFTRRVVARYGTGGRFWREHPDLDPRLAPTWFELFNEPYGVPASEGGADLAAYARTAAAAVDAGRAANARARFLIAGETTAIGPGGREVPWLEGLYDAVPGFGRFVDGVAAHPYSGASSPTRWTPGDGDRYQTRRIERLRDTMVRRGDGRKPVWLTEIGWSTCPKDPKCVTPRAQATHLSELFALASKRWPWVQGVIVFSMEDYSIEEDSREGWYGLVRFGRPKPSWYVLQQVTRSPLRRP